MSEKTALLEKQADMLQLGADSSGRVFAMQQEVCVHACVCESVFECVFVCVCLGVYMSEC